jgi:hypothetical protein
MVWIGIPAFKSNWKWQLVDKLEGLNGIIIKLLLLFFTIKDDCFCLNYVINVCDKKGRVESVVEKFREKLDNSNSRFTIICDF